MFDNYNPYKLTEETTAVQSRYFVSFHGVSDAQKIEVKEDVYTALQEFIRYERALHRRDERHEDFRDLSKDKFYHAMQSELNPEQLLIENEQQELLQLALSGLPEAQRRRYLLHHEHHVSVRQIAETEQATYKIVLYSIKAAEKKVAEFLRDYELFVNT